ncbi:ethanolamine ammonia-lyase small subunit [Silvibacterium bohemicum]|uniref:Ethanolamine ammonia-lyase small subunit n=1 Tax=Silvibacterium bohemicum TaxID=1577686 RepID=A0A841JY75_9BACT|nr:ethanolamine ammonia-lyase subunit EutC [Silvibacterium bohemicum]MBB6146302.1 ethanolamine ammonia-lyase small subunit [Silvibacterium bohemicum]
MRAHTPARVALRTAGSSLATAEILDLNLCLAEARDAVHSTLSTASLMPLLRERGWSPILLKSAARDRHEYLRRPDLGRKLSAESRSLLDRNSSAGSANDLVIVIADGLSAIAVERHTVPLLDALTPLWLGAAHAPVIIAEQARVAIGDEIGELLQARLTLLLIGERPGLSSPDSLGAYITWAPRIGRTDAERNCISNIRPEGLSYADAAARIAHYLKAATQRQLTGVALKDDSLFLPDEA